MNAEPCCLSQHSGLIRARRRHRCDTAVGDSSSTTHSNWRHNFGRKVLFLTTRHGSSPLIALGGELGIPRPVRAHWGSVPNSTLLEFVELNSEVRIPRADFDAQLNSH